MEALIDLFWSKYRDLQFAVEKDDPASVRLLDRELDPLLEAIFQHQVSDPIGIQAQFQFALDLLKEEADDSGCVHRNGHLLQMLVERYLAPQIGRAATARVAGAADSATFESNPDTVLDALLFDRIPERIMVVAPGYRIFYSNETNAQRLGQAKEKLLGRHFADLMGVHHFQRDLRVPIDRCLRGESLSHTYAEQRGEGTVVVRCRMSPCYSNSANQVGALVVIQEMPDRRRPRLSN
ncbi:MAG: PAS domain-containing protein [Pseudorhizobium sp.]